MSWFEAHGLAMVFPMGAGEKRALDDFSLSVERGEFVGIVGRSGSGKTTFLRIVAGLLSQTSGSLFHNGRPYEEEAPKAGMVFQEPRLMPWLNVEKNVLFPHLKKGNASLPRERAAALLRMLGLAGYERAWPAQLSGGMAQRVALGRALCYEPDLILMDEPLGALDYFTRRGLQEEILKLYLAQRRTIFFVTHDVEEALLLSGRIVVVRDGRIAGDIPVDLPYPRNRTDVRFASLLGGILALIMS